MTYLVYFAYIAPPMIALFVSGYAKSMVAKWLLRGAAVVCILTFGLVLLANYDCVQAEFRFSSCDRLPDAFGDFMGPVQIIFVLVTLWRDRWCCCWPWALNGGRTGDPEPLGKMHIQAEACFTPDFALSIDPWGSDRPVRLRPKVRILMNS